MNVATVYKSTGSWYKLKTLDGNWLEARVAGKIRLDGLKSTNPVAVGDQVAYKINPGDVATITKVIDRKNYIVRKSNKLSKQTQVLAANVDYLIIIASLKDPKTSFGFIDRLTVAAVAYRIPPIICFNKSDTWTEADQQQYLYYQEIYTQAGFETITCSAINHNGIALLKEKIEGKRVLLSGHSGVGKSSIINALIPNLDLRVGVISNIHKKGKHTTTFAEMVDINQDTQIIDTPGIRDFGLIYIEEEELPTYFPEMFDLLPSCKYYNCRHTNEPNCAVLKAVEEKKLAASRYYSYLSILANEDIYQ